MADSGKLFFEVFPTIKVNNEMEILFSKTVVKKVTMSSDANRICICILSDHLIDYQSIRKMCRVIKKELFSDKDVKVTILQRYELPGIAGTDAHNSQFIGMAATVFDTEIRCNNDLILAIKNGTGITVSGTEREDTLKGKAKEMWFSQLGYKIYNRGLGKAKMPRRKFHANKLNRGHKPFRFGDK